MRLFDANGIPKDGSPGPAGANGVAGADGPMGPAAFMAAQDGEDGWHAVPGERGPAGAAGAAGARGSDGPIIWLPGEDGEDGMMGPQGPAGASTVTTVDYPGTVADLVYWIDASKLLGTNGRPIFMLGNRTPWILGPAALAQTNSNGLTVDTTQLNGLNCLLFPGGATGRFTLASAYFPMNQSTIFVVGRATGASSVVLSGPQNSLELDFQPGASGINLTKTFVAVIGSCTASPVSGTFYQFNATYNDSSGAYAFRFARAAAGSGTNAQAITASSAALGYNAGGNVNDFKGSLAEMLIYARVLSGTEIANVESYLLNKWGV